MRSVPHSAFPSSIPGHIQRPPSPAKVNGDFEYQVKIILDFELQPRMLYYIV
jgi:hypothetical protein